MTRDPDHPADPDLPDEDWNAQARDETDQERLDRNFLELLQELRVAQAGVQILFAFLLSLAFTQRFAELTSGQRDVYIVALVASAVAAALFIGPVAWHRLLLRNVAVIGVGYGEFVNRKPGSQSVFESGVAGLVKAGLRPPPPVRFPLSKGAEALQSLADGGVLGKVVLEP